jgi:hypothetical protein
MREAQKSSQKIKNRRTSVEQVVMARAATRSTRPEP